MDNQYKIAASIMCSDFLKLKDTIEFLNNSGCDYLHLDVMDGSFSNDYMMGNKLLTDILSISTMAHDYHLMIRDPEAYIGELSVKPQDLIIVHWELCKNMDKVLELLKNKGCKIGIAVNAGTAVSNLDSYYKDIDVVLIMLTRAGKMGNEYQESCLEKITQVRDTAKRQGINIIIEADGSVNSKTIPQLKKLGVNIFVGGSSGLFFRGTPIKQSYDEFRSLILN